MTLQIDIDEETLADVDESLNILHQDREDFFRQGIKDLAAKAKREAQIALQYRKAYGDQPVKPDEFYVANEQLAEVWKDI